MTPKQEAALRLALEVMESDWDGCVNSPKGEAVMSLREALAEQQSGIKQVIELYDSPEQPAQRQEPVAWLHPANATCVTTDPTAYARGIPLYTSPQPSKPWVGLTDGQLNDLYATHHDKFGQPISADHNGWGYERALEAKLREKNT